MAHECSHEALRHVRQLVGHHRRELRLVIRHFDRAPVDEYKSPRQRERIDFFTIYAMKFPGILHTVGWKFGNELEAELRQVCVYLRVIAERQTTQHYLR